MFKRIISLFALSAVLLGAGHAQAQSTSLEDLPLWRLQVKVHVCDRGDAGTDDSVSFVVNGTTNFYIDTAADDFERNKTYTYDLVTTSIDRVSDIDRLTITKSGNDGLCFDRMELLFNNVSTPFFVRSISGGHWIDGNDGHIPFYSIAGSTMRSASTWNLNGSRAAAANRPTRIDRSITERMIEATIGHVTTGNDIDWGHIYGRPVEAEYNSSDARTSQRVDLDLEYDLWGPWNPGVDVDYRLDYSCSGGVISSRARNITVSTGGPDWLVSLFENVSGVVSGLFQDRINKLGQPGFRGTFSGCPSSIRVENDADLTFTWPARPVARRVMFRRSASRVFR